MEGRKKGTFPPSWLFPLPVTLPQILIPALMVTAEKDPVLVPEMSKHMEDWVRERSCPGVIGASWQRAQALRGKMAAEDTEQKIWMGIFFRGFLARGVGRRREKQM